MASTVYTIPIPHLPRDHTVLAAAFRDVQNAPFLRQQLLDGNPDFEYALLDARMIISTRHLTAAVWRAVNDAQHGRMRSKNVHSEIVFCLSQNNNISQAFQAFGVSPDTTSLIVVKIAILNEPDVGSMENHLRASVDGTPVALRDEVLGTFTDLVKVRNVYKLNASGSGVKKGKSGNELVLQNGGNTTEERADIEAVVLGLMALRGI